jgi:hypothetical protein
MAKRQTKNVLSATDRKRRARPVHNPRTREKSHAKLEAPVTLEKIFKELQAIKQKVEKIEQSSEDLWV